MTIDEVRDVTKRQKIHLGQIVWTPFGRWGAPRGSVVRQNPYAGATIDSSDVVSLQVSAGPRESGYVIRQVHATVTVPDIENAGGKAPVVRVEVRDETGRWSVYNAFAQPKQRLDFNLTVVGTAELDMYVNNELLNATRLGVEPTLQEKQIMGPPPPPPATPRPPTPKPSIAPKPFSPL
jgi:beta-lactam-binding protein with PASTA domain